ncbi:hypothetical protein [Nocardiopsis halotolerans]|uniref:hypothetical protein n=1 Tax=Nocardiopsis halotolerans TaxID=124252 RepID=UPI0004772C9E|nr:hypothetical protein [Nocardiopsis halotolerans]
MRAYSETSSVVSSAPVDVLVDQEPGHAAEGGRTRAAVGVHASRHPHRSFAADVLAEEPVPQLVIDMVRSGGMLSSVLAGGNPATADREGTRA